MYDYGVTCYSSVSTVSTETSSLLSKIRCTSSFFVVFLLFVFLLFYLLSFFVCSFLLACPPPQEPKETGSTTENFMIWLLAINL